MNSKENIILKETFLWTGPLSVCFNLLCFSFISCHCLGMVLPSLVFQLKLSKLHVNCSPLSLPFPFWVLPLFWGQCHPSLSPPWDQHFSTTISITPAQLKKILSPWKRENPFPHDMRWYRIISVSYPYFIPITAKITPDLARSRKHLSAHFSLKLCYLTYLILSFKNLKFLCCLPEVNYISTLHGFLLRWS